MTTDQEHVLEDEILRLKLLYRRCKKAADAESDTDRILVHQAEMERAYRLADAIAEGLANTRVLRGFVSPRRFGDTGTKDKVSNAMTRWRYLVDTSPEYEP